ncbi:hypothetical protein GGR55DRAFT_687456 [Xylaria sp. FL0064]|nr:hypothetical protein GGR55DRAFT_687456 [Xylaria sp. FL0064]
MAPIKFKSQLEASSYHAPGGGELYKPLREKIVSQALAQGYDEATMMEHGVSFEEHLKEKFQDLMKVRGIGVIVKTSTLDIKRPVSYPDSIIVANMIDEVKHDRYHVTTTMWSLRQQVPVAETNGWVVFYDYSKAKPASLIQAGGIYAVLHAALVEKAKAANQKRAKWNEAHPKKPRDAKL